MQIYRSSEFSHYSRRCTWQANSHLLQIERHCPVAHSRSQVSYCRWLPLNSCVVQREAAIAQEGPVQKNTEPIGFSLNLPRVGFSLRMSRGSDPVPPWFFMMLWALPFERLGMRLPREIHSCSPRAWCGAECRMYRATCYSIFWGRGCCLSVPVCCETPGNKAVESASSVWGSSRLSPNLYIEPFNYWALVGGRAWWILFVLWVKSHYKWIDVYLDGSRYFSILTHVLSIQIVAVGESKRPLQDVAAWFCCLVTRLMCLNKFLSSINY